MKNKVLVALIIFIITGFFISICFASENKITDLKSEMNDSLNKSEKTIQNTAKDIFERK